MYMAPGNLFVGENGQHLPARGDGACRMGNAQRDVVTKRPQKGFRDLLQCIKAMDRSVRNVCGTRDESEAGDDLITLKSREDNLQASLEHA